MALPEESSFLKRHISQPEKQDHDLWHRKAPNAERR